MTAPIQWQNPQLFWAMTVALSAALAAIICFYRPQARQLPWPWSVLLPGLRLLVLAVLSLSLLGPSIRTPAGANQRGTIAVLVDQSASMGVVDTGRAPEDLVKLGAGLGVISPQSRPSSLRDLRQRMQDVLELVDEVARARSELEYARLSARGIESAGAHLRESRNALAAEVRSVAASAPPPLRDVIAAIGGDAAGDRIARVLTQIDTLQVLADQELYRSSELVRQVCADLGAQSRQELVRRALQGSSSPSRNIDDDWTVRPFGFSDALAALPLEGNWPHAAGRRSDLASALRELRRSMAVEPVAAVVLFSDGRQVGADSNLTTAWPDVPIIAVNTAAPISRDVAIERVWVPATAYTGQVVSIRVDLRAVGCDGTTLQIHVNADGTTRTEPAQIQQNAGHATLALALPRAGPQELVISVSAMPGEATMGNNQVRRVIKVVSERVKVAILKGLMTRDSLHLRRALAEAPGMALVEYTIGPEGCSASVVELLEQDVLVLSDVPDFALSAEQWEAINRLVSNRGGSVVILAGDPNIIGAYAVHPVAAALLPWRGEAQPAWRVWPGEDPVFRIVPSRAEVAAASQFWGDLMLEAPRWDQLSPVFRALLLPPLKPGARAILIESDSGLPVLTETRLGSGRVYMLGLNEIWRWRGELNLGPAEEIWLTMIRHAARVPYAVTSGPLSLDADRLQLEPGEALRVKCRIQEADAAPAVLQLERAGAIIRTQEVNAAASEASGVTAVFPDLAEGDYRLHLRSRDHLATLPFRVAASDEAEMRDVSGDMEQLGRLVGPKGHVLQLSEVSSLPLRLKRLHESEPRFAELRLWDSPYLFLFVLGCLGLEWGLRNRVGLA